MDKKRPTQLDISKLAGVSRATVSMALRGHPGIPKATQQKIREASNKLGYKPDPMLSALASYRNNNSVKAHQGTLAWLVNIHPDHIPWMEVGMFTDYYKGAKNRCMGHGYTLDIFDYYPYRDTPHKLGRILRSRNINGIFACPQPTPNTTLHFPWEDFCAVTFGFSLVKPQLHTVAPTQFRSTTEIMRQLHRLGYKNVGFACSMFTDQRTDHNFLAGYLVEKYLTSQKIDIPLLDGHSANEKNLREWYDTYRPDAIVIDNPRVFELIKKIGIRVPRDLGVACLTLPHNSKLSGIQENSVKIGEAAADFLIGSIRHGNRGIPEDPQYIYIRGKWKKGATTQARK